MIPAPSPDPKPPPAAGGTLDEAIDAYEALLALAHSAQCTFQALRDAASMARPALARRLLAEIGFIWYRRGRRLYKAHADGLQLDRPLDGDIAEEGAP